MRDRWSEIATWTVFSVGAMVFGAGMLERMVYVPNWLHDVPDSLMTTQAFLAVRTPAHFAQLFVPALLIVTPLAAALSWHHKKVRWSLVAGFLLFLAVEVGTFAVVYPHIGTLMSDDVVSLSPSELQRAADAYVLWGFTVRMPLAFVAVFGFYLYAARSITACLVASED